MSVKRYQPYCCETLHYPPRHECVMRPIDDATEDCDQYVEASDYEALAAELAEARSDRQREHELRVRYAGVVETQANRIRRLEGELEFKQKLLSTYHAQNCAGSVTDSIDVAENPREVTAVGTSYRSTREMPDGGYVYAESLEAADAKVTAQETSGVKP